MCKQKGPAASRPLHRLLDVYGLLRRYLHRAVAGDRVTGARRSADVQADPISRLEGVDHGAELRRIRDLRSLHLADHVPLADADFAGGRDVLDARHDDAREVVGEAVLRAHVGADVGDRKAEAIARRLVRTRGALRLRGTVRRTGGRLRREDLVLAVAEDADLHRRSDRQVGDVVDQLAVVANRPAVDVDADVAVLDAGRFGRRARLGALDLSI